MGNTLCQEAVTNGVVDLRAKARYNAPMQKQGNVVAKEKTGSHAKRVTGFEYVLEGDRSSSGGCKEMK